MGIASTPVPLQSMRRYVTLTLVGTVAAIVVVIADRQPDTAHLAGALCAGAAALWLTLWWQRTPPRVLALAATAVAVAWWYVSVPTRGDVMDVVPASIALGILAQHATRRLARVAAVSLAVIFAPLLVVALLRPAEDWRPWLLSAAITCGITGCLLWANSYQWSLTEHVDRARKAEGELALLQERYRFASDLHDIQGHTLHALKLSLRVARKTIPSDPQAAAARLEEAEHLVEQALRDTRGLATGEREMNIGFELANAEQLARAAGIEWQCTGEPADASDELLAILLREATTNLLRHATATRVEVTLAPGLVSLRNDGARPFKGLRGLANLSNRFSARGGTLSAQCTDGWFTVTGRLP